MIAKLKPGLTNVIRISPGEIRRNGPGNIVAVCVKQWQTERALARRGVLFRTTDLQAVEASYSAMSEEEFDAVNGRQEWANWRTIARSMSGLAPNRPVRAIDLGCGTGGSTRVLACYLHPDSSIVGYELAEPLVSVARRRRYLHRSGQPIRVDFVCQGITRRLHGPDGEEVADRSVDLANASGVVGHHLCESTVQDLAAELRRVLVPDGLAMLDPGPALPRGTLRRCLRPLGFDAIRFCRSSTFDPFGQIVFRLRPQQ